MPAGSEAVDLPARFRPFGVRYAAVLFGTLLLVTVVVVWISLPEQTRDSFTWLQRVTVGLMVLGGGAIGYALARCRVDADEGGVTVVNGFKVRRLEWTQVLAVSLRPGSPWAVLDLSDGTTQAAMGIQGSDGARAQGHVRRLRALVEQHAAPDPRD